MIDDILMLPLSMQCGGFVGAVILGAFLALIFAVIKSTRTVFHPSIFMIAAEDIMYCVISSAAIFAFLMEFSYGRLRWYIFIGVILGWIMFKLTVGDIISSLLSAVLKIVIVIVGVVLKTLFYPIKSIYGYIIGKTSFFAEKINIYIKKLYYKCKFRLKKYRQSLYNFLYTAFNPSGKNMGKGCEHRGKKKKTQKQLFR